MTVRNGLLASALVGFLLANLVGAAGFTVALQTLFPGIEQRLAPGQSGELEAALANFRLALGLALAAAPLSVMVTEARSHPARYGQAAFKSLVIATLLASIAVFFHHETLTSAQRLAMRMPQFFPNGAPPIRLSANPLTSSLYFTAIGLILFGPIDLMIAHVQKIARQRNAALQPADPAAPAPPA